MRKHDTRAQAAMEFLMTYGWAVLVVMAAIAALAYFGVLSPDRFLPEKCTLPAGVTCTNFIQNNDTAFILSIQNSKGYNVNNARMVVYNDDVSCSSIMYTLQDGKTYNYDVVCDNIIPKGKFKGIMYMNYTNPMSSLNHSLVGEIIMGIQ